MHARLWVWYMWRSLHMFLTLRFPHNTHFESRVWLSAFFRVQLQSVMHAVIVTWHVRFTVFILSGLFVGSAVLPSQCHPFLRVDCLPALCTNVQHVAGFKWSMRSCCWQHALFMFLRVGLKCKIRVQQSCLMTSVIPHLLSSLSYWWMFMKVTQTSHDYTNLTVAH